MCRQPAQKWRRAVENGKGHWAFSGMFYRADVQSQLVPVQPIPPWENARSSEFRGHSSAALHGTQQIQRVLRGNSSVREKKTELQTTATGRLRAPWTHQNRHKTQLRRIWCVLRLVWCLWALHGGSRWEHDWSHLQKHRISSDMPLRVDRCTTRLND